MYQFINAQNVQCCQLMNFDFSIIDFSVILKNDNFTTSGNTVKVVNLKGTQDGTDFWFWQFLGNL